MTSSSGDIAMPDESDIPKSKKPRAGRSPSYPSLTVKEAIEQARALQAAEGDYAAPLTSALRAWGYSHKSSAGRQTLATMKYYGLIDIAGDGEARKIKVSDIARRIILDEREDDTDKRHLIRKVALTPAAHKALFEQYPTGLASDGTVSYFLVHEQGFNPEAAKELIGEFKETSSYCGLYQPQSILDKSSEKADSMPLDTIERVDYGKFGGAVVGDLVQWEIGGVLQMEAPMRVRLVTEDGRWVAVEGSETGIPMEQVVVHQRAPTSKPEAPKFAIEAPKPNMDNTPALAEGWKEERLIDDGGEEIFIRYRGEPTGERYTYIRDYLDFKLSRMKKSEIN
jgi:hypothetical protein